MKKRRKEKRAEAKKQSKMHTLELINYLCNKRMEGLAILFTKSYLFRQESKHRKRQIQRGHRATCSGSVVRLNTWKAGGEGTPSEG
jgi:hypothetical protein